MQKKQDEMAKQIEAERSQFVKSISEKEKSLNKKIEELYRKSRVQDEKKISLETQVDKWKKEKVTFIE